MEVSLRKRENVISLFFFFDNLTLEVIAHYGQVVPLVVYRCVLRKL